MQTILITEPFILTASKNWDYAVEQRVLATDAAGEVQEFDTFFGRAGLIDVFDPAARDWFWSFYRRQMENGVAYMHSDLGGYTGGSHDPELYIRWMQYGVFQPIYRPHAHPSVPPEPIFWDEETKAIVREAIRLRYRLLPYVYTLMFENSKAGLPLMRPLMFADDRPEMLDRMDAYLWGDALLISPILQPDVSEQQVPLPRGSHWFDLVTGERYEGGRTITVSVSMEHIPVFVRGGAFLPTIPVIQNAAQYDPGQLRIDFYADPWVARSSSHVYDDDGTNPAAYELGQYELLRFRSERMADGGLVIGLDSEGGDYPGRPPKRLIQLRVHGLDQRPHAVRLDGKDAAELAQWDEETRRLELPIAWEGNPRMVEIVEKMETEL